MIDCKEINYSGHAVSRMFERRIQRENIIFTISNGEVIAEYPEEKPYPAFLILGFVNDQPLHVVIAFDQDKNKCYIITVYIPDKERWYEDFQKRRK